MTDAEKPNTNSFRARFPPYRQFNMRLFLGVLALSPVLCVVAVIFYAFPLILLMIAILALAAWGAVTIEDELFK